MGLVLINNAMTDLIQQFPLPSQENRSILRNAILQLQVELNKVYLVALIELDNIVKSNDRDDLVNRLQNLPNSFENTLQQVHVRVDLSSLLKKLALPVSRSSQPIPHFQESVVNHILEGVHIIRNKLMKMADDLSSTTIAHVPHEQLMDVIYKEMNNIRASMDFLAKMVKNLLALI